MNEYFVAWEIELSADSLQEAAAEALRIMRDPDSIATAFSVQNAYTGEKTSVDAAI